MPLPGYDDPPQGAGHLPGYSDPSPAPGNSPSDERPPANEGPLDYLKRSFMPYTKAFGQSMRQVATLPLQLFDATAGPDIKPPAHLPGYEETGGQPGVGELLNPIPAIRDVIRHPTVEGVGGLAGGFAGGMLTGSVGRAALRGTAGEIAARASVEEPEITHPDVHAPVPPLAESQAGVEAANNPGRWQGPMQRAPGPSAAPRAWTPEQSAGVPEGFFQTKAGDLQAERRKTQKPLPMGEERRAPEGESSSFMTEQLKHDEEMAEAHQKLVDEEKLSTQTPVRAPTGMMSKSGIPEPGSPEETEFQKALRRNQGPKAPDVPVPDEPPTPGVSTLLTAGHLIGRTGADIAGSLEGMLESAQTGGKGYKPLTGNVGDIPPAEDAENITRGTKAGINAASPENAPDIIARAQTLRGPKVQKGYEADEAKVDAIMANPQALLERQGPLSTHEIIASDRVAGALGWKAEELSNLRKNALNAGKMDEAADLAEMAELHKNRAALFLAKASRGASEEGRLFNYLKNTRGDYNPGAVMVMAEKVKGMELTATERMKIAGFVATHDLDGMTKYIAGLKRWAPLAQVEQGWKDGLISGVSTAARIATTPLLAAFNGITKPARAALSAGLSGWTGVDSDVILPSALRAEALKAAAAMTKENLGKISRGVTPRVGPQGDTPFGVGLEAQPFQKIPLVGPFFQSLHDIVNRTHSALHQMTVPAVYQFKLYERSYILARESGLTGSEASAKALELAQNPDMDTQAWAAQQAWNYTLLNRNTFSNLIGQAHQTAGKLGVAGLPIELGLTYTAPFSRISGNIVGRSLEMTPLGGAWAGIDALKLIKAVRDGAPKNELMAAQAQFTSRLVRAGAGTAAMFATGYFMARHGLMMGAAPEGEDERRVWDIQGRSPYAWSTDGKTWHDTRWLGPLGLAAAMGAGYATDKNMVAPIMRESFLSNAADFSEAMVGKKGAWKTFGQHAVEGLVPNVIAEGAKAADPYARAPRSVGQMLESRIPFLSRNVDPKFGVGGTPLQHQPGLAAFGPGNFPKEPTLSAPGNAASDRRSVLTQQFESEMNDLEKQMSNVSRAPDAAMNAEARIARMNELRAAMIEARQKFSKSLQEVR